MLAILAAAAVSAAPADPPKAYYLQRPLAASCGYWRVEPTDAKARLRPRQLGDLPLPNHELTVLRTDENGCSKAVTVREKVSGDGRFAR